MSFVHFNIIQVEYPYTIEGAYQNEACDQKTRMHFSITANDLTPVYTPADSLATTGITDHSVNAVRLHSSTKRKTAQVKFRINKLSRGTDKGKNLTTVINAR
jgi:hypothetical protein